MATTACKGHCVLRATAPEFIPTKRANTSGSGGSKLNPHAIPFTSRLPTPSPAMALAQLTAILTGVPMPTSEPLACEPHLLRHPLRCPLTGLWEVPPATPIKHRYTEAELLSFKSNSRGYEDANWGGSGKYAPCDEWERRHDAYGRECSFWFGWF